ncbi:MAG: DUF5683 domain-containing protein [Flavobacterium sp.]|nr:DUF5683 domain-containing protein [Flavobacterium sp.]
MKLIIAVCCLFSTTFLNAQSDKQILSQSSMFGQKDSSQKTTVKPTKPLKDSAVIAKADTPIVKAKPKHNPRIATRRSLYFPGLGQIYNREYWKLPIVYGAIAIPTYTYIFNTNYYKELQFAYEARYKAAQPIGQGQDSTDYKTLLPIYKRVDVASIQSARNATRKNRDYSILWFFIVWGLNVADATVFGHLKNFDVSNDLTLNIKPTFNPTTRGPGISLVVSYKTPTHKMSSVLSK